MNIQLAIHNSLGSFSDRWIRYCNENGINYKVVCCYDSDILEQIKGVDGLLWHWSHKNPSDQLTARRIIASSEMMGIKVFPNMVTCWHFDDKIAQKYLLESIGAPLVKSYVFYDKKKAIEWIDRTEFPKVFKLSCGAGSQNVQLVNTRKAARKLCVKAFGKGFAYIKNGYFGDSKGKIRKIKSSKQFIEKLRRMPKAIYDISKKKHYLPRQRGYIYFQEFLPNNEFDTRVVIIGNRAFALRRRNRKNDFRASASGLLDYDPEAIDKGFIKIAFGISKQLCTQSLAYDFLYDCSRKPRVCEISYCFPIGNFLFDCQGYWDDELVWYEGHVQPEDAIIIDLINEIT